MARSLGDVLSGTKLASWNEGSAKTAVLNFVQRVTSEGPDFVPVADRVAAFDNDGTLWVEQPLPPQLDFVFRTWAEEIKADPSMAAQQPYKALVENSGGAADFMLKDGDLVTVE